MTYYSLRYGMRRGNCVPMILVDIDRLLGCILEIKPLNLKINNIINSIVLIDIINSILQLYTYNFNTCKL